MPIPTFTGLGPSPKYDDIVVKVNTLVDELTNLMLNLDTLNIVSLNAEVIEAGTITGDKIAANAITANEIAANAVTSDKIAANAVIADKIAAGAVIAEKIDVEELSAITANLGTVTAGTIIGNTITGGTITGALIQTAVSGNRISLDSINGLQSFDNAEIRRIAITQGQNQQIQFRDNLGVDVGYIEGNAGALFVVADNGDLVLSADGTVNRSDTVFTGSIVSFEGVLDILGLNIADITSLQDTLDGKAEEGAATNLVAVSDSHNHGFSASDYIQCYDSGGTPTVKKQWFPYGGSAAHSHIQN